MFDKEWAMQKRETPELCDKLEREKKEWENNINYDNIVLELKKISDNLYEAEKKASNILKLNGYKDLNDE